ncbi:ORP1 like protein [Purpureocillium lavendulum]|uniref:ORP1 like protein n=1 Tax=Purpureocillium lavendulum TaxID=1247861 RepID=A0AB34FMM2_9HYPO|nr:ORP1 like protein [Purpureocillium lavendulum]
MGFCTRPEMVRAAATDPGNRRTETCERRAESGDERPHDTDRSEPLRHKFSDSNSSLSSYSSWQSRSHSRISSVTTVSGPPSVGSSLADRPILESKGDENEDDAHQPRRLHDNGYFSTNMRHRLPEHRESEELERPASPSDAILLMKTSPRNHQNLGSPCMTASATGSPVPRGEPILTPQAALGRPEERKLANPSHLDLQKAASHGPPRTMPSSPLDTSVAALPSVPRSLSLLDDGVDFSADTPEEPRCMFVANCDTGSQLRKAISHLFGRNKSCTLKIPKDVWVYYCRKHYQRIRYRNARTYPSNQMELVKVQIVRLQRWSEANKAKGSGPYIKQWTLSLRKREQNRLESGKGVGEDGDEDSIANQGGSAVPDWIIQTLGDGYTTEKMLDIAERLHQEIARGSLSTVPEIEFLPDIVDGEKGASARPVRTRRQDSGSKTPKRKALDLPGPFRQDPANGDVFSDDHDEVEDAGEMMIHSGKRARLGDANSLPYYSAPESSDAHQPRSAHPYMVPAYGDGYGRAMFPPRAPHIVPKMSAMDYTQARAHGDYQHHGQPSFQPHAHSMSEVLHRGSIAAYGPDGVRYTANHGGADSQAPLPSISARVPSNAGLQRSPAQGRAHGAGLGSHASAARPSHHRSSSAYSLASRHALAPARPSSSGTGEEVGLIHRDLPEAMYSVSSHPQSMAGGGDRWASSHYSPGRAWPQEYGQAFAPRQQVVQRSPVHSHATHVQTASPRAAATYSAGKPPAAFGGGRAAHDV